ncbi:MAG: hypothetical protein MK183_12795 [Verrucomicrobiales bacterium]|nr:hypothetical protein [Verrucomicrobiales bacterium]
MKNSTTTFINTPCVAFLRRPVPAGSQARVMTTPGRISILLVAALLFISPAPAFAQWVEQQVTLRPGWNSVYLTVEPESNRISDLLDGVPVKSVWCWNNKFTSVRYIDDPSELIPEKPGWFSYFPDTAGIPSALTNLFTMSACRAYLIELDSAADVSWTIRGKPVNKAYNWRSDSFNLVGFQTTGGSEPSFTDFFASSPAHAGQSAYRLDAAGKWQEIAEPGTEPVRAGEAYWVYCEGASSYTGPVAVKLDQDGEVNFGRFLQEHRVLLTNQSSTAVAISTKVTGSGTAPVGQEDMTAGVVPLSYWDIDLAAGRYGWYALDAPVSNVILPGESVPIKLSVRRADMTSSVEDLAGDARYRSLLEITSDSGMTFRIPVISQGPGPRSGVPKDGDPDPVELDRTGLWVGYVVANKVSYPGDAVDADSPQETGQEAQFRVIIHVDDDGNARFLQQVYILWEDGDSGAGFSGGYRLVTDDSVIGDFEGSILRGGRQVGRRISTVAFGFDGPQAMTGSFGEDSETLSVEIVMGYNDPLNPFKHKFHPDHDNLNARFDGPLPEGIESLTITRNLEFAFTDTDPDGLPLPGWGDNALGGIFEETISGVHRRPIVVGGTFRLTRVSEIGTLELEEDAAE